VLYVVRVIKLKWLGGHVAFTGEREMLKNMPVDWKTLWENTCLRDLTLSRRIILKWA
jgi:hypothetical protein